MMILFARRNNKGNSSRMGEKGSILMFMKPNGEGCQGSIGTRIMINNIDPLHFMKNNNNNEDGLL
jgi:hypothetical protein